MINQNVIIVIGIFISLVAAQVILKIKKPVRCTVVNVFVGMISLLLLNVSSDFTGLFVPINFLSLGVSAVAGVPGVTLLLALNFII